MQGSKPRWRWDGQDLGYETPCWIWLCYRNKDGYGRIGGRPAHCVLYEQKYGKVPDGFQLDHKCKIRACVNPDHVEPVTSAENTRRGKQVRLSMRIADEIRDLAKCGLFLHREIAGFYKISRTMVGGIVTGYRWRKICE